jgi:hypothetical protein
MRQPSSVRRMRRINAHKPQVNSYFCRFTRGRSLVRSQPGPPESAQVVGSNASLDTTRGPAFGPFMRPICGQVADWPHGGRSLATSRRRTSIGPLRQASACQATTALGCAPTTSQHARTRLCGRCPTLAKSRVRRRRSLTRRPESSAARLTSARSRLESRVPTAILSSSSSKRSA